MVTKLRLITKRAKEDRKCKFNNLMHLLDAAGLKECFHRLKKNKAAGIDEVTAQDYSNDLAKNIEELIEKMKRMSYRPQAVRRVYIPKAKGKKRPLGIPVLEDKIVQMGFSRILEAIYEVDFMDYSYGFRRGRNCHQALARLDQEIMRKPVNYVIDADIKGFFDNVDHDWMKRFIEERVSDKKFVRYIQRFLKSGVMESGKYIKTVKGTPQGGVVSPILANIYLHYVLDLWFEKEVKVKSRGSAEMVRYADDFVICVQYRKEAEQILEAIRRRLRKFGLELSEEKTRILEFGRKTQQECRSRGNKPGTFNFLGFTHYCARTRNGRFKVGRKTEKKRYAGGLKKIAVWLKTNRSKLELKEIWNKVSSMLTGHFRYFGVSDNFKMLNRFHNEVERTLYKWLNRRSQRKSFNWDKFCIYLKGFPLPKPKIYHNLYNYAF
jgi:group II intron reverse transcriptase/maturase